MVVEGWCHLYMRWVVGWLLEMLVYHSLFRLGHWLLRLQMHHRISRDWYMSYLLFDYVDESWLFFVLQMLGENLYPLVDQLEHEQAAKVTGMLLEMDQTEVLHLLESPDALKAKVAEAMEVLHSAQHLQQTNASPEQQLANLSLNDGVISS
jgi:hypothetical protein